MIHFIKRLLKIYVNSVLIENLDQELLQDNYDIIIIFFESNVNVGIKPC